MNVQERIQLKSILFLTDFSTASGKAAKYALNLTQAFGSRLVAAHVRPPVVNPMTQPTSWRGLEEAAKVEDEDHRNLLRTMFPGVHPKVLIAEGDFWSNASQIIHDEHIDLIVMGTRGRSGVARLLLGSVAEETFRKASCPVLTVGRHADPEASREFTRILFATDLTAEANGAVRYALSLAQEYQSHLTLLHVVREPQAYEQVQPHDVSGADENLLRKLVPQDAERWCVADFVVERGETAEKILDVASRRKVDLIVLGARKETGLGGAASHLPIATIHDVVCKALCPVLTIPI